VIGALMLRIRRALHSRARLTKSSSAVFHYILEDLFWERFPEVPVGYRKKRFEVDDLRVKAIANFRDVHPSLSLVFRRDHVWLGTCQTEMFRPEVMTLILPQDQDPAVASRALKGALDELRDHLGLMDHNDPALAPA